MAKINYSNEIAPQIIEEARKRIFNSFKEKGYIDNIDSDSVVTIEEDSIAICTSISYEVTKYYMNHNPSQVNTHAPVYSSLLSVFAAMALTIEWAEGNTEAPEILFDEMMEESPIDIFDEYLLEKIGIKYQSDEFNDLVSLINQTYIDNWIYIHKEAEKKGIGTQIMFVIDSLKIMLSLGVQIEKKRLGL